MPDEEKTVTFDYNKAMQDHLANNISIKMPPFSETYANGWFDIIDAQFAIKGIKTSSTKFIHAVASLTPDMVADL